MMVDWKPGYTHTKADPEKVYKELEKIGERTPVNIVQAARNKKSEMHNCFTWEGTEAAERWRLHEASQLVNHLVVSYSLITNKDEKEEITVNVYASIPTDDGRRYVKRTDGMDNEVLKEMILSEVRSLLSQAKNKMRANETFFSAKEMAEVEKILEKIA